MRRLTSLMLCLSVILCAFQCGKENIEPSTTNPPLTLIKVLPNVDRINTEDTLWLSGKATSKAFDFKLKNSVVYNPTVSLFISIS